MKGFLIKFTVFILVLIALFFFGMNQFEDYKETKSGEVKVFEGASVNQISSLLQEYDIVKNGDVFYYYIKLKNLYLKQKGEEPMKILFKHGEYKIEKGDFESLIAQLNEGPDIKPPSFIVTIPEGSSIEKIASIVEEKNISTKETFFEYIQNKDNYNKLKEKYAWLPEIKEGKHFLLEGYLHANTYYLPDNPTVEILIDMMLNETNSWYENYKDEIKASNLTFDEIITIASIVEAESKFSEDRPKVAQVFLNRIVKDMKFESDMTAAYANGEHKVFMYNKDIEVDSPFNTYKVKGIPIGPINSPSKESFLGVIKPEGKDFKGLYFYARPNGETFYAETWQEHDKNRQKWEHEWKELERNQ